MSRLPRAAPSRPASRRRLPRAERERQMLDSAAQVFGRRGYHAAAMDEIARACGVTKPMLYAYFQSKEGLYLATVDRMGRALVAAVEALLKEPDPGARLQQGVDVVLRFIDKDRHAWSVLYAEGLGEGPVARHVARYRERIVALAALTLSEAVPGNATPTAAEPYAVGLLGAGEAIARWWLAHRKVPFAAVQVLTRHLAEAVLAAYQRGAFEPKSGAPAPLPA